jgi:phosphohistidine phosphatase
MPMKYVSIFRHAKTEPPEANSSDFDRELTSRGHKDAKLMSDLLVPWSPPVDWILSSTAARARATTHHLVQRLKLAHEPVWRDDLYAAHADTLLSILAYTPDTSAHVALIAHNPGLEELAAGLCTSAPTHFQITLPTAAIAHIALEIAGWNQIRWGCGRLEFLIRPKLIRLLA